MLKRLEIGVASNANFSARPPVGASVRRQYGALATVQQPSLWARMIEWLIG